MNAARTSGRWLATLLPAALGAALVTAVPARSADAAEQRGIGELHFDDDTYTFSFSVDLEAPARAVLAIMQDHAQLTRLNKNVAISRVVERTGPTTLTRYFRVERCILGYCFRLRFTEDATESASGVRSVIRPEGSSYRGGHMDWRVQPLPGNRSRMTLAGEHTPDFWIPPLIGPPILEHVFLQEIRSTALTLEQLAQQNAATASDNSPLPQ